MQEVSHKGDDAGQTAAVSPASINGEDYILRAMMEHARREPIADNGLSGQASYRLCPTPVMTGSPSNAYSSQPVGGRVIYSVPDSFVDGAWHHAAGVFDGQFLELYLDGVLVASTSLTAETQLYVNDEVMLIAHGFQTFDFFPGSLDDIRIYERALSEVEIQGLTQE
jgi:hypothetical protein